VLIQRELAKKLVKSAAELPVCNAAYAGDAAAVSQLLQSGAGSAKEVHLRFYAYIYT
jgi:hypothetical protein